MIKVVKNLQIIVDIEESSNITTLEVPDIKTVNEIETTTSSMNVIYLINIYYLFITYYLDNYIYNNH